MQKTVLFFTLFDIESYYRRSDIQSVSLLYRLVNTPFPFRNKMPVKDPEKVR